MTQLADWIEYGQQSRIARNKAMVRRWCCAARCHLPIIDRRNYPPAYENSSPIVRLVR
jgi:hypothetical protein